ncbi:MAG: energy transducer TonB [Terriglobales bacterium]
MNKQSIRPCFSAIVVVLSLGLTAFQPPLSLAQEQSDGKRKVVSRVAPAYPDLARKMRIAGTVKVEVVIAPSGKLKLTQVIGGNPLLVKAAVDAIEQWKWEPAPQETKERIELNFHP